MALASFHINATPFYVMIYMLFLGAAWDWRAAIGAAIGLENALRDPFVFEDHLFYVAGGESAIAVTRMEWF